MTVLYKLDMFEGPLDLLLHLIDEAQVDINDIPISMITDQYMEYVNTMQEFELDVASEFLVMAATLLSIKSKLLLPKPPVLELDFDDDYGIDPREELVQQLLEYRKYKAVAAELREKEEDRSLIYSREPEDLTPFVKKLPENPVKGLHVSDLVLAFQKAMRKASARTVVARIRRDEISVKDRMNQVMEMLHSQGGKLLFSKLFERELRREEIVVTFLSLLELMKIKRIQCYQHKLFDDIVIVAREGTVDHGLPADEIDY